MMLVALLPLMALLAAQPLAAQIPSVRGTVVVTNKTPATATIVDVATGATLATLPTGQGPHEIVLLRDNRTAVITDYGAQTPGHTLTVIDIPSQRVVRTVELGTYRRPHGIVALEGTRVVVTSETEQTLLLVDVGETTSIVPVPTKQSGSHMVGVASDGRRAWTGNIGSNTVSELDLVAGTVVRNIQVPAQPEAISVRPDGREVWVGSNATGRVSVVDAQTGSVTTAAEGFGWPYRVLFTRGAKLVLLPDYKNNELRFIEQRSRKEIGRLAFNGQGPQGITLSDKGKHAFLSLSNAASVAVIDVAQQRVVGTLAVGETPDGVIYSPIVATKTEK